MRQAKSITKWVLKTLGTLLIVAAALKSHQLLTEPLANKDIWSYRPVLILLVECELALGLWLVSGLFPRLAWLTALACFSFFCLVTLYKALTGAASCGCFGSVSVNPWITLLAIDLPAVLALTLFHPADCLAPFLSFLRRQESIQHAVRAFLQPLPSGPRFTATGILGVALLGLTAPILAFHEPAAVTSTYEVLEPKTWIGRELPILEHIDIAEQIKTGNWLLLFYHHDCPDCQKAIPQYEQMARDLTGNEDLLRIALIEVPPYGQSCIVPDAVCPLGRLADAKEWFITTPAATLLRHADVKTAWEAEAPDLGVVLAEIARSEQRAAHSPDSVSPRR